MTLPLGYISLVQFSNSRSVSVNIERICAYGVDKATAPTHCCWIALSGRESLLFVSERMSEIGEAIEQAQAKLQGKPT